jgi:hypothetical protein
VKGVIASSSRLRIDPHQFRAHDPRELFEHLEGRIGLDELWRGVPDAILRDRIQPLVEAVGQ